MLSESIMREIIEEALDREVPEFQIDHDLFEDYKMDSMGAVVMVVEIQRRTKVRIPDDVIPSLRTAKDYLSYIEKNPGIY